MSSLLLQREKEKAKTYLLKKAARLVFVQPAFLSEVIEELAGVHVLHHHVHFCRGVDDLEESNYVRVKKLPHDVDLFSH